MTKPKVNEVAKLRKKLDKTQPEFAELVGVQVMTIWRWEKFGLPTRGPSLKLYRQFREKVDTGQLA